MTDERADAGEETASLGADAPDEGRVQEYYEIPILGQVSAGPPMEAVAELAVAGAASVFAKAFLETLGKRAGDGLTDLVLTRMRIRKDGKVTGYLVGVDGDAAATILITGDLPDEARLALLDLDVTAPELRGRELRWDAAAGAWRPSDALPAKPDEAPAD